MVATLSTTLHETIGHASGSLEDGLTNEMRLERLGQWGNGLEEMRAEILAMYVATHFYDDIVKSGILGDWPSKVPKEDMFRLFIQHVAGGGIKRWQMIPENETKVTQAHALADTGIMYYLIDHCDQVSIEERSVTIDDQELQVLGLKVGDVNKVLPVIEKLAYKVQQMSSTAVPEEVDEFMKTYAASTRDKSFSGKVKHAQHVYKKGVIVNLQIFPELVPIIIGGNVIDVLVKVPEDPFCACVDLFNKI